MDLLAPMREFTGHLDAARDLLDPTTHRQEPLLGPQKSIPEKMVDLMEYMDPTMQMFLKMGF